MIRTVIEKMGGNRYPDLQRGDRLAGAYGSRYDD